MGKHTLVYVSTAQSTEYYNLYQLERTSVAVISVPLFTRSIILFVRYLTHEHQVKQKKCHYS